VGAISHVPPGSGYDKTTSLKTWESRNMAIQEHEVVIGGAGPTGMILAAELALAGTDVALVERRPTPELAGSRAGGLHARSLEILDQRGIVDQFIEAGRTHPFAGYAMIKLDLADLPSRHNYVLALWQNHIERILFAWVDELGIQVYRGVDVTGFTQDESGVEVALSDGHSLHAQFLVGCDGGRSIIRKTAGIAFPGSDPTVSHLLAELEVSDEPEWGMRNDEYGSHGFSKIDNGLVRVMITERSVGSTDEPTLADLSAALIEIFGSDYGIHSPVWLTRFTDMSRQAETYRAGRVLLAGDAAHIHYPAGGQGLNTGLQDAVNLGWKLAQVVKGISPDALLDTYHTERHPVAARVLRNTMAQTALRRPDDRSKAAHGAMAELLAMDEPRRTFAAMITGMDIHYDLGEGHPLLGRRMPDLDLDTAKGPRRLFTFLHDARPLVLNLGATCSFDLTPWAYRVLVVDATYRSPWELPALGAVAPPTTILIRPDGHVAWVGEDSTTGLEAALTTWFGPPSHLIPPRS
jgi:3-(3-hydroxy-phenyl)propionate hydroxylase